ncbi:MAG: ATP-binding cassette domain-containing protein [Oscillospiraceae bacterium]|jgi:ABC-type dipeptide/oligopeptide/nickel transport system ATPase component|nr:ATP-binding cassette domain-containing protein [Oscillospiraceae bacterium]
MLNVENLSIVAKLERGDSTIVSGLSFTIGDGEQLGIVGESGCGKTMTVLALMGLLPKNCRATGRACVGDTDVLTLGQKQLHALRGREMVYIPQSGADFLNPSLTVRAHFYETLKRLGVKRGDWREQSEASLHAVGFHDAQSVLCKYPFQLSGGMAQRVVLALGLAAKPQLVIADEPTRGLDRDAAFAFVDLLKKLMADCAVAVITHDHAISAKCSRVLELTKHAGNYEFNEVVSSRGGKSG